LMAKWHSANAVELGLPQLYEVDDVVTTFRTAGFEVSAARLAVNFVPAAGHGQNGSQLLNWLSYYYDQKLLFRFGR
jgi:hypothetical protein